MNKLRKMLLLATMVVATAAFVAPAMAQAEGPFWYANGSAVGGKPAATEFEGGGDVTLRFASYYVGCEGVTFHGQVWNGAEGGTGEITELNLPAKCYSTSGQCVAELTNKRVPLPISLDSGGPSGAEVSIHDVYIQAKLEHYNGGTCQGTVPAEGILTGPMKGESVEYNEALLEDGPINVGVDGAFELYGLTAGPNPSASLWAVDGEAVPMGEGVFAPAEAGGVLVTRIGSGILLGPCYVEGTASLSNGVSGGAGSLHLDKSTVPCETNFEGCEVSETTYATNSMPLSTGPGEVTIDNVQITYHYTAGCLKYFGVSTISIEGSLTGEMIEECLEYEEAGGLATVSPVTGIPAKITGYLCFNSGEKAVSLI